MAIATELTINSSVTALDMANAIFGQGITVVDATYSGDIASAGIYSGAQTSIPGIVPGDTGVILSTGKAADFTNSDGTTNTNLAAGTSTNTAAGIDNDAQLNAIAGMGTFDGSILQATFIPDGDFLTMQFVFTSEEYPEYVNGGVNDSFGVWINGNFVPVSITVAGNVSIDEVNSAKNENLYRDNTSDQFNTEMDGFTYTLSFKAPVTAGQQNTIKIGIADGGDAIYDSNLLIVGESIQTYTLAFDDQVNIISGQTRTYDILANDNGVAGTLSITSINGQAILPGGTVVLPSGQSVTLNANGTVTITGNGPVGEENFSYTVSDGAITDVGFVTINTVTNVTKDGIVSGTAGDDIIDAAYVGDIDGDLVDANDGMGVSGTIGDADLIYAGSGNDTVLSGSGNDIVDGGTGNDSIVSGDGADTVSGELGDDTLSGGAGQDLLSGGAGKDVLVGGADADTLRGGADADIFYANQDDVVTGGETTTDGGSDNDILVVEAGSVITYGGGNNEAGTIALASGGTLTFSEIENIVFQGPVDGTAGDDVMNIGYTDLNGDQIDGTDGNDDTVFGYAGNDSINAGAGDDQIFGGIGNDTVFGGAGNDYVDLGDGSDTYGAYGPGVGADTVFGGAGSDTLTSDNSTDALYGGIGNDVLSGGGGRDTLFGGDGNDVFLITDDHDYDQIVGGEGGSDTDAVNFANFTTNSGVNVTFTSDEAGGYNYPASGATYGDFSEIERISGTANNDVIDGSVTTSGLQLYGNAGTDFISGGAGNDQVFGGTGNDKLYANAGNDLVYGGDDEDAIYAGSNDVVAGGEGGVDNDTLFVTNVTQVIYGGGNNEAGVLTFADGTTLSFTEIEKLNLNGGNPDGLIFGTSGNDLIGAGFVDNNGDVVDNNDAILSNPGSNDDEIYAGTGDDTVNALLGQDSVFGGEGNDLIDTGSGNDNAQGDEGDDAIYGGTGEDYIRGDAGNDSVYGGDGNDSTYGGLGNDVVYGGVGDDSVFGGFGLDTVYGGAGNDSITGSGGNDSVFGDDGNDLIQGSDGDDTLFGGAGNDTMLGEEDADTFYGGAGDYVDGYETVTTGTDSDTLYVTGVSSVVFDPINPENGTVFFTAGGSLPFYNIEFVFADGVPVFPPNYIVDGTTGNDVIVAGYVDVHGDRIDSNDNMAANNDDIVLAGSGDDTVVSADGADLVYAGTGNDSVLAGDGNDTIFGEAGNDTLNSGAGNDSIIGGLGTDSILAGDGDDWVTDEFIGNLATGGNDVVDLGAGNDVFVGSGINPADRDLVFGGTGDDNIRVQQSFDTVYGGDGNDTISTTNEDIPWGDSLFGDAGNDRITGANTNDVLFGGTGEDSLYGGSNNDTLSGDEGDDLLFGGTGNDSMAGGSGNDSLSGDAGNDVMRGDVGNDTFSGGDGADQMSGGDDRDTFFGGLGDTVDGGEGGNDFDVLDLRAYGFSATNVLRDPGNPENGTVQFLDATGNVVSTLNFTNIEQIIACFTTGAMILTNRGEVPIEKLNIGDLVLTRDNGFQPIRWVGQRDLSLAQVIAEPKFAPIQFAAGSLGHNTPERMMRVSPQHRMLMTGSRADLLFGEHEVLIVAKHMIGMPGITQVQNKPVTYVHLLFDQHEIIRSDGAWSESFQPGTMTLGGLDQEQRQEILALFPELAQGAGFSAARIALKPKEAALFLQY